MKYIKNQEGFTEDIHIDKEIDFNKKGLTTVNAREKVFAKKVDSTKDSHYFIITHSNQIYDPMGIDSTREKFLETKLKRVTKDTFDFYLIYLQTNNSIYLTRANRRFINE